MKKLFPLMFALVFANQAFALESEVVVTEVAPAESVVLDEATKAEAKAVYDELKTRGLTDAQVVAVVEEKLQNETTEGAYRSILDKHNQEKIVWALVGAIAGILVFEGGKWAYNWYKSGKPADDGKKADDKPADDKKADDKPADDKKADDKPADDKK